MATTDENIHDADRAGGSFDRKGRKALNETLDRSREAWEHTERKTKDAFEEAEEKGQKLWELAKEKGGEIWEAFRHKVDEVSKKTEEKVRNYHPGQHDNKDDTADPDRKIEPRDSSPENGKDLQ